MDVVDPDQAVAPADVLALLFSDVQSENAAPPDVMLSPVSVYDLHCHEDPMDALGDRKYVRWSGLPSNPPEWITGERRAVPRTWTACKHVVVLDGLMCLHDRQAPSTLIKTMACSTDCPVWV